MNSIEAKIDQATAFVTLGVTDHLDVSFALPVIDNELKVVSEATIRRLGTTNPLTHFFRQSDGEVGERRLFTAAGRATGIGDLMIRLESAVARGASNGLAAGVDVRLPAGDEMNLLGSGAAGIQPFVVWSGTYQSVSPHVKASYKWNGDSVLAGNPATGESKHFPDQAAYAVGADLSVNPRLTIAFDILGQYLVKHERLHAETFHALDGRSTFPSIVFLYLLTPHTIFPGLLAQW